MVAALACVILAPCEAMCPTLSLLGNVMMVSWFQWLLVHLSFPLVVILVVQLLLKGFDGECCFCSVVWVVVFFGLHS